MSNFSGLSAILSVSLVALVTIQMLKEKFEMVENYGETDEYGSPFYTQTTQNDPSGVQDQPMGMPPNQDLSKLQHNLEPFKAVGDFFQAPYISKDASMYSGVPDSYRVYMQNINNSTPSAQGLDNIGSHTHFLPGPDEYITDGPGGPNFNSGRAKNLSLCSQNYGGPTMPLNVASSLLPSPGSQNLKMEGFADCNVNDPTLANQVFLTPQGQTGLMTNPGIRNANLDIRSLPPNPMLAVGPWNNSTIYPDLLRRPLEGCGPSFGVYGNGAMGSGNPTTIQ